MVKLRNAAPRFFALNPEARDGISPDPSLFAALRAYSAARLAASLRLKSVTVVSARQVLTGPNNTSPPARFRWCERGDSNPHTFRRQNLNLVRLPIPPLSLAFFCWCLGTSELRPYKKVGERLPCRPSRLKGASVYLKGREAEIAEIYHCAHTPYHWPRPA